VLGVWTEEDIVSDAYVCGQYAILMHTMRYDAVDCCRIVVAPSLAPPWRMQAAVG